VCTRPADAEERVALLQFELVKILHQNKPAYSHLVQWEARQSEMPNLSRARKNPRPRETQLARPGEPGAPTSLCDAPVPHLCSCGAQGSCIPQCRHPAIATRGSTLFKAASSVETQEPGGGLRLGVIPFAASCVSKKRELDVAVAELEGQKDLHWAN